jgi:hypothetical protein
MEEVKYDLSQEPIVMSKGLLDTLLNQSKPADLISLYTFYYYTAKWQRTNQPRATTGYVAKGLQWSEERVQSRKKTLLKLNLIEDIQSKNEKGQITGHYVKVNFIWGKPKVDAIKTHPPETQGGGTENDPKTTPQVFQPLASPGGKCFSSYNRNALINNNKNSFTESNLSHNGENPSHTVKPRSTPIPNNTIPLPSDEPTVPTAKEVGREIMKHKGEGLWKLLKVVRKVERMPSGSTYWFQQCTIAGQMVTIQGIELNRILEVISWLFAHHNDEFVPKFYDAMEFRNKFFKLETAMLKAKQPNRNRGHRHEFLSSSGEDKFMVGPNGSMAHFPMHKERKGIYADPNQILVRV